MWGSLAADRGNQPYRHHNLRLAAIPANTAAAREYEHLAIVSHADPIRAARTALEIAEAVKGPAAMARDTVAMWNEAEQALGSASDHTAMYQFLESKT